MMHHAHERETVHTVLKELLLVTWLHKDDSSNCSENSSDFETLICCTEQKLNQIAITVTKT